MAQSNHESVLVERYLVNHDVVRFCDSCEQVSQSHVERPSSACGDYVGREWPLDLLDQYPVSRRDLESGCVVLVEEVRQRIGDRSVETEGIRHHLPRAIAQAVPDGDVVQD